MIVRDALPGELAEVGDLRVTAYRAAGFMSPDSRYAPTLRALGADGDGTVLVAVDDANGDDGGNAENSGNAVDDANGDDGGNAENSGNAESSAGRGRILGTVMLQFWPHGAEISVARDEAEIRALAVAPGAQGRGTGRALLRAVIERAAREGIRHLVLLTQPEMVAAQHLYQQAGFRRLPERDWAPVPAVILLAYGLALSGDGSQADTDAGSGAQAQGRG